MFPASGNCFSFKLYEMISGSTISIAIMAASLERNNAVTLPPTKRRTEKTRAVFRFTKPAVKGRSGRFTWSILKSIKSFKEFAAAL